MDPINILVAINLFLSMSANMSGAKKGLKSSVTKVQDKPNSYLQKLPPNLSAIILIIIILGIFQLGTFSDVSLIENYPLRIAGLALFIIFSWTQVFAFKSLGKSYTPDVAILKEHELQTGGVYKLIRHPQYLSQFLGDLGASIALLSFVSLPLVILIELPLFILRARMEEKLLTKHFSEEYTEYKKKSGFLIPFIG